MSKMVNVHSVDRRDNIIFVDDDWLAFAAQNGAPGLTREAVIGRPLWDFIEDAETRHVFSELLGRVRRAGAAVTIPFRCDSPDKVRLMEMDIIPLPDASVQFVCSLLEEAWREPVPLFDAEAARTEELVTLCSWCRRVRLAPERWVEIEVAVTELDLVGEKRPPRVTHGICPECNEIVFKTKR